MRREGDQQCLTPPHVRCRSSIIITDIRIRVGQGVYCIANGLAHGLDCFKSSVQTRPSSDHHMIGYHTNILGSAQ